MSEAATVEFHQVRSGNHFLASQESVDALMANPNIAHVDGDAAPFWSRFSGVPIYIGECPCEAEELERLRAGSGRSETPR